MYCQRQESPHHLLLGLITASLVIAAFVPPASAGGLFHRHRCTRPSYIPAKQRVCRAGEDPDGLQVHAVGQRFNSIEAYFQNEFLYKSFADTSDLGCGSEIILAPANDKGTFAVVYGKHRDRVMVFGWKKGGAGAVTPRDTGEILLEAGFPVSVTWVSTRIVKVKYGANFAKTYILRFDDADEPWTPLFQTDHPGDPYDPDKP